MDIICERRLSAVENRITATDKHLQRMDALNMDAIYERRLSAVENHITSIDMVGKWLLKDSSRIKILEQRVSGIIRNDAHTEHRINELEAKMAALQRQADHIDDQALPSITCDLDVLRGRTTAVEHTAVTTLIRMNDIVDLQQQIDELHDAICSLVDDLDEPAPIMKKNDALIDAIITSLIASKQVKER